MEQIRESLERLAPLSDGDWALFSSKLRFELFPKKSLLLRQGEVENDLSFVADGIVRLHVPREENDLTFGFVFANDFVSGYDSFLTRTPASYSIEALTQTHLWRISYEDLQAVYQQTNVGERIGRRAAESLFLIKSARELSLLNKTAEQRYLDLFADRPTLIRQIPLKYIASYIGVTPQALSRIRRRIS